MCCSHQCSVAGDGLRCDAQDALEPVGAPGGSGSQVQVVDDALHGRGRQPEAGLAGPQRRLAPAALGDVAQHRLDRQFAVEHDRGRGRLDRNRAAVEPPQDHLHRWVAPAGRVELPGSGTRDGEARLVDQRHGRAADDVGRLPAAEQIGRLLVGQDDHAVTVDMDRVRCRLDQGAVALLAFAQGDVGAAACGDVEDGPGRPRQPAVAREEHPAGRGQPPLRPVIGAPDPELGLDTSRHQPDRGPRGSACSPARGRRGGSAGRTAWDRPVPFPRGR